MTDKEIQKLIDSYLNGSTSPEDERKLARELLRPDLPDEWLAVRLMLGELAIGEAEYDTIMESRQQAAGSSLSGEHRRANIFSMRRWFAVAASLLIIIGIGTTLWIQRDIDKASEMTVRTNAPKVQKADVTTIRNTSPEKPIAQTRTEEAPKTNAGTSRRIPAKTIAQAAPQRADTTINRPVEPDVINQSDPYLHYATNEMGKDTLPYQAPSRMDEFIAKMAEYNNVEKNVCPDEKDTTIVSTAYVFEDSKEQNLFARLLQAACWYSDETPGYLLNFSHQQFFFELKDTRCQLHYRWIAERINGQILLYSTHAPLGTQVSSACYQEYRDELMHIRSINNKTRKI